MSKKSKKIDQQIDSINQINLTNKIVEELLSKANPGELFGKDGLFQQLKKQIVERVLASELEHDLGYSKHSKAPKIDNNRRNGSYEKTIIDENGNQLTVEVPRDREGEFTPQLLPKGVRRFNGFDDKVISLYARGMSMSEIQGHLEEIYQTEISKDLISTITDGVIDEVTRWQNRPLDSVYPILYLDCIHVKSRDNNIVINKAVYLAIAVNIEGKKELLGIWIGKNEGSKFWMQIITELKNRGVEQIYVACVDGLKGFPEAIAEVFPKTEIQLCVVHQIRNSLKYVASKEQKAFMADLKLVYKATSKDLAEHHLLELNEKWGKKYPAVMRSWSNNWEALSQYFKYPEIIRRMIYTTNIVEGFHRQIRKYTKNKGAFTSENALNKLIYCACQKVLEKWNQPMHNWGAIVSQLQMFFDDRLHLGLK